MTYNVQAIQSLRNVPGVEAGRYTKIWRDKIRPSQFDDKFYLKNVSQDEHGYRPATNTYDPNTRNGFYRPRNLRGLLNYGPPPARRIDPFDYQNLHYINLPTRYDLNIMSGRMRRKIPTIDKILDTVIPIIDYPTDLIIEIINKNTPLRIPPEIQSIFYPKSVPLGTEMRLANYRPVSRHPTTTLDRFIRWSQTQPPEPRDSLVRKWAKLDTGVEYLVKNYLTGF